MFDRECSFERLHEKTKPFCIKGERKYLAVLFEHNYSLKYNDVYSDVYGGGNTWYKTVPNEVWLN